MMSAVTPKEPQTADTGIDQIRSVNDNVGYIRSIGPWQHAARSMVIDIDRSGCGTCYRVFHPSANRRSVGIVDRTTTAPTLSSAGGSSIAAVSAMQHDRNKDQDRGQAGVPDPTPIGLPHGAPVHKR